jgi:hypothetical protein
MSDEKGTAIMGRIFSARVKNSCDIFATKPLSSAIPSKWPERVFANAHTQLKPAFKLAYP